MSAMEDTLSLFQSIGLSEAKAKDTVRNDLVSTALKLFILEVSIASYSDNGSLLVINGSLVVVLKALVFGLCTHRLVPC